MRCTVMSLQTAFILSLALDTVLVQEISKISDIVDYKSENVRYYFSLYKLEYNLEPHQVIHTFEIFARNIEEIIELNKLHVSSRFGINEFTRMDFDTFTVGFTGFNDTHLTYFDVEDFVYADVSDSSYLTTNIVWLGPTAKHQVYGCKVSYAFSAVGLIESAIYHKFGEYRVLSVQQGFDCEEEGSCRYGGLPHKVLHAYKSLKGILAEDVYPYQNMSYVYKKNCRQNLDLVDFMVTGVDRLNVKDEVGLMGAVYIHGPLVTAIYVSNEVKNYQSGVLEPTDCNGHPNHAVLLVGYGMGSENVPYWQIKNSWGPKWGQQGYLRLIRGKKACGIGSYVVKVRVDAKDKTKKRSPRPPIILSPETMTTLEDAVNESLSHSLDDAETTTVSLNLTKVHIPHENPIPNQIKNDSLLRTNGNIAQDGSVVEPKSLTKAESPSDASDTYIQKSKLRMGDDNTETGSNNTTTGRHVLAANNNYYDDNFGDDNVAAMGGDISSSNPEGDAVIDNTRKRNAKEIEIRYNDDPLSGGTQAIKISFSNNFFIVYSFTLVTMYFNALFLN